MIIIIIMIIIMDRLFDTIVITWAHIRPFPFVAARRDPAGQRRPLFDHYLAII